MISSASTLFLAALVLTTSVFSAPIRLPVVATSEVVPQLVAKTALADVQPIHRRSELGIFSGRSARLLTEREPLPETPEVPVARDIVEELEVRRRFPRRAYEEYYKKREPQPELVDVPAPVVQKREEHFLVYPRRVYYEHYEKRAFSPEPATKIKETTTVTTTKVSSTLDSHEDLAARNINPGGSTGTTESTLISTSQTRKCSTPASDATAIGVVNVVKSAPATATTSASPSVATVSGSASSFGPEPASAVKATGPITPTTAGVVVNVAGSAAGPVAKAATPSAVVSGTSSSVTPADTGTSNPGITAGGDNT